MSSLFRLRTATLCVAGALLVPCAAFAQGIVPSIIPADKTAPVPAPVASSPTTPSSPKPIIDSLEIKDVDVTEALSMIAGEYKVPIAISDVSGRIKYLNLTGQTPEQAIDTIVRTVGLLSQKTADGTYIISNAPAASAPSITPFPSANPNQGFGGTGGLRVPDSATSGMSSVEPKELVLVDAGKSADAKKRTFKMTLKNIKPSLMAYWLDPANNAAPSEIRLSNSLSDRFTRPQLMNATHSSGGISTSGSAGLGMDTRGVVPNPSGGINPLDPASNPFMNSNSEQVQTLSDAQFGVGNGNNGGGNFGGGGGGFGNNNGRGGGQNGRGGNQGVFQLPQNVDRIVAVDPQNALLVFGTPQGAQELAATIAFLDRPLRQVEIEAQFVSINVTDASAFGLDFTSARGNFNASATGAQPSGGNGALQIGFLRGNFQAALTAFQNNSRAKVLTAPRVLAINNLTASLSQSVNFPIVLNTQTTVVGNAAATNNSQNYTYITTQISLDVTPTINNDDTITVLMRPQFQDTSTAASGAAQALGLPQVTTQELETIANVRDGETIALGGLRRKNVSIGKTKVPVLGDLPFVGGLFRTRNTTESDTELIIFLTARIVRRAGDDDVVPGTALGGTP